MLPNYFAVLVTYIGFRFDGVEQVNYARGEMMYTNPAYSTVGDEGVVTFESKPKLLNSAGVWWVGGGQWQLYPWMMFSMRTMPAVKS